MEFRKYDHVERFGHSDVTGIDAGLVHVFPKLDGTNASLWLTDAEDHGPHLHAGSRTRVLEEGADNAGFLAWMKSNELPLITVLMDNDLHACRVYGEWLVPHTLKTYREEAWRRFWIFDVWHWEDGYLPFDRWAEPLRAAGFDVVDPLCTIENPTEDQLRHQVELNTYLIADGAGVGEGIVLKNYAWRNQHGRQPWAKIVRNEFKEENRRAFGTPELRGSYEVEAALAEEYVTPTLVAKTRAKIVLALKHSNSKTMAFTQRHVEEHYRKQMIPRLLQTVYSDVLQEELPAAVKKYRDPTINFKRFRAQCVRFTKRYAADLF